MLSAKIRELETASTQRIYHALGQVPASQERQETQYQSPIIPEHFTPQAKAVIEKLLASNVYNSAQASAAAFSWVSTVKPFSIHFTYPHPSTVTLDGNVHVFNEIITNVTSQGEVNYQVKTMDGTLHYIDIQKVPHRSLRNNHLNIVVPHQANIEEEKSAGHHLQMPRRSF